MTIHVIDNFIPTEDHLKLKDFMMSYNFPWFYINSVTWNENPNEKEYYFVHHFLHESMGKSNWYNLIQPIVDRIKVEKWLRIKGNLYPNVNEPVENLNHKDYETFNRAAVYSVNTNNGGTIICGKDREHFIESKENRIVFFEGNQLHRSKYCTDEKIRVNINMNFL